MQDIETGFYYLQSRYYDPELGRFINADVFTSTGQGILGNNMFAYCNNNPVNNSDCNGESAVLAILGGMAIGAIASVVSDYLVARIRGNEYSLIDGFESGFTGAAIGGFMAAGLPPEAATIIGGALGTMYRGILQEDSAKTILKKLC